ncbi:MULTISPECIES: plastocyanin/azurin family copper-binding protein [Oceanobacillus]|uniref:plastocyanin/azurin family copper-binding protein n=1 Tax=Oceanobacillus TaxID=182709 RepID=UPI000595EAEC|nr:MULTISPECIES: plastocyanin/azurin family copper-binding protein [Oceanobacillus]
MPISLYVTVIGIFILTIWIIWNIINHRNKITVMTGMMISMVLGMVVGLTIGVIIGVLLSEDLFSSTLWAIIIGISVGFVAGLPIGLMAVLDGILAGLMGGMMGAMLGDMIAPEHQETLIKVMFLLFIGIVIILYQMMQQEFIKSKSMVSHPVVMIVLFVVFIVGYNQMGTLIPSADSLNNDNHQHGMRRTNNFVVQAEEYTFLPSDIEIKAGEMATIILENTGETEHDLEIIGMEAEIEEQPSSNNHTHTNNQIHLHTYPGERKEVSFTTNTPGTYRYICTLPGHEESGMTGMIDIIP